MSNLSYSKLETFKLCPLQYKYRYIFNLPEPPSHASSFGSSVHNTLKEFYQLIKRGGADKVSLPVLYELYEKNWIPYGYESKAHANTRKKKGRELLSQFYEKNSKPAWIIPIYLERSFVLKLGELTVKGRIDRLDKLPDGSYEVIDYKTGQNHKNTDIKKDLQLSIYALVCQEVFKLSVSKLSLYFLEDNEKISTERSRENLDQVKEEIATLTETIKTSDFSPTPGWHCGFCNYRLLCPAYK